MKAVLAISGGVDSMVMLDIFRNENAVVAHFDHGTRESSVKDAIFVCKKTTEYEKYLETKSETLGGGGSEEMARGARYKFLREAASKSGAEIYTAHHLDDLVESVAINLVRGTGWRGLAVLDTPGIRRPFLEPEAMPEKLRGKVPLDKKGIQEYAAQHGIVYRQDPTNNEDNYLRNRLRERLKEFKHKKEIYELWQKQKELKTEIDKAVQELMPAKNKPWQRSWFRDLDEKVALELLRAGTLMAGISATRPQLKNLLQAILTYKSGKSFNLPNDKLIKFKKDEFCL